MRHRIGIDLGGTKTEIAVLDPAGAIGCGGGSTRRRRMTDIVRAMAGLVRGGGGGAGRAGDASASASPA